MASVEEQSIEDSHSTDLGSSDSSRSGEPHEYARTPDSSYEADVSSEEEEFSDDSDFDDAEFFRDCIYSYIERAMGCEISDPTSEQDQFVDELFVQVAEFFGTE